MGFGGISPGSLLLILVIALVVFGSKKIIPLGEDLGKAINSFKKGLTQDNKNSSDKLQVKDKNEDNPKTD